MLSFFEGFRSGTVRLDDIEAISPERQIEGQAVTRNVRLRDGRTFEILEHNFDEIMMRPTQLISAQAGMNIIRAYCGDGLPGELLREPVIGWALCADGEIRAVSPNGVNGAAGRFKDCYVEMPDGGIQAVGEWSEPCFFRGSVEMLTHFEARAVPKGDAT